MINFLNMLIVYEPVLLILLLLYLFFLIFVGHLSMRRTDRRARHILESIDESFFGFDTQGNFVYVNRRGELFLNKSRKEILGKNVFTLYPEFQRAGIYKYYLKAKKTHRPVMFYYKASNLRDYVVNIYPSKDGMSVYFNDVTRIKKTEEKLVESEHKFREMADSAPVLIWMSDLENKRFYFNKTWLIFRGRKLKEEYGRGWLEGVHPDDRDEFMETNQTSFDARIEFEMEYRLKRFDGQYHWMLSRGMPRFDKAHNFLGYIGSVIDISDRKEIEERKDEFISIASHELKTPVTSIKAFTQLLLQKEKKDGDKKSVAYLERVDHQVNNLTILINDLLDVSKIEQGKLPFHKKEAQFSTFLLSVVDDLQETYTKHKIITEQNDQAMVIIDEERIRQVLINLIDNAIKYSPGANQVIVRSHNNGHSLHVSIKDFGLGIPKEKLNQIFDRFYRVNGPKSETFGGLGLGLYISSEIIKRHGGRMWVKSEVTFGSTFFFSLPLLNK